MKLRLLLLLLLSNLSVCIAADVQRLWKIATDFYLQKQYDSALSYYEELAKNKPANADLYYNLGNVYYRLNNVPKAVLNYERALKYDPNNKDAQDNLAITQARITKLIVPVKEVFFVEWWNGITEGKKSSTWATLSIIILVVSLLSMWMRKYSLIGKSIPVQVPSIMGIICIVFLLLGFVSSSNSVANNGAVVIENDAPLMTEADNGKILTAIPEGTTINIISKVGSWVEVKLPDGREGWLLLTQIETI